jgi:hypothetical protein
MHPWNSPEEVEFNSPFFPQVTAIKQPIQDCEIILAKLRLRLSNMTFVGKHIIGRKWDKEYQRLVKRLDDASNFFDVILQGDQS